MPNNKKIWEQEALTLRSFDFPSVKEEDRFEPLSAEQILCNIKVGRGKPTGEKFQCPDCWEYYEGEHECKAIVNKKLSMNS